ncbi:MAG: hypothetical protein RL427_43 [Bacteroidota bacterium]|jgi:hypothetical protein
MALDNIEKLVTKYFEAETSIAEEKELKAYFSSSDVAPHLEQYKSLFGYAVHAKQEQYIASVPLKNKKGAGMYGLSIAATVIVLLGVSLFTFNQNKQPDAADLGTYNDPEVALKETQKALAMISEHVNKGIGSMSYLAVYEQSKNRIFK